MSQPATKTKKKVLCYCDEYDDNNDETSSSSESSSSSKLSSLSESQKSIYLLTKQRRKEKFKVVESVADDKLICELDLSSNENTEPSLPIDDNQSEDSDDDIDETSNDKQFTAPELDDFWDNEDFMCPNTNVKFSESWILIGYLSINQDFAYLRLLYLL
ncbi:hypothetical protein GLOIN_2v1476780 [Rhizophagus clarus]|uniref:Uncharacterized protein n=1 Tax=Rhizophagus clarus TaxID=94130 RepID=A0A8H3MB13_9GLOM|nr:hypothetical protein GLOIN_2v1476780 [Rhizophagus clarus]